MGRSDPNHVGKVDLRVLVYLGPPHNILDLTENAIKRDYKGGNRRDERDVDT